MSEPSPQSDFPSLGVSPLICRTLNELGYREPTPIQTLALPPLLAGKDLSARSRTGSGKTAAFAIPLLARIKPEQRGPQALVLCPTRDLGTQVTGEIRAIGRGQPNLQVMPLAGGQPIGPQQRALERGPHVVVATPGRLLDHLRRGSIELGAVALVVLDEADRMLDMGFRDDIDAILEHIPASRQNALFSATFPEGVQGLAERYLRQPLHVEIEAESPVEQWRVEVEESKRTRALVSCLAQAPAGGVIVFCNRRETVDTVHAALREAGFVAERLHGAMTQPERELALARFRNGSATVLVASDVAARGLDISGLAAVINYELPEQFEVYVHRIGRSGRAGAAGLAVTLHTEAERESLRALESWLNRALPVRQLSATAPQPAPPRLRTLLIAAGRKDKLRPGDVLGALTQLGGLGADQVGKIEVGERTTYVAVDAGAAVDALKRLRAGRIKGRRLPVHLPR